MKEELNTQEDNIERIHKVVKYIEQNLDQNLTLENLAKLAHYSPFHFQRVFKSKVGETPAKYVKRGRLQKAVHYIALKPETPLLEVALRLGFTSLETFSRAFKNYYGVSPDVFRKAGEEKKLSIIQKKTISKTEYRIEPSSFLSTSINEAEFKNLKVRVVKLPARKLIYIPGTLGDPETVAFCFKKVKQWAEVRELTKPESKPFGLMWDYPLFTPLEKCRYFMCMEVKEEPEVSGEINYMELPLRTYATFIVKGGINAKVRSVIAFANLWLPESGYEISNVPAIQIPLEDPVKVLLHELTCEFYLAIRPK